MSTTAAASRILEREPAPCTEHFVVVAIVIGPAETKEYIIAAHLVSSTITNAVRADRAAKLTFLLLLGVEYGDSYYFLMFDKIACGDHRIDDDFMHSCVAFLPFSCTANELLAKPKTARARQGSPRGTQLSVARIRIIRIIMIYI